MPLESMSRQRANWRPAARAAISLAILGGLAAKMDWALLQSSIRETRWSLWFAAVGVYVAAQVLSAVRWRWLSQPLGFDRPLRAYVGDYFVGMFFNLLLPTSIGGDAMRAISLNARSGRKLAALMSVLLDRLSGLLVLLILACGAALICPIPLPRWMVGVVFGAVAAAALGLSLLPTAIRLLSRLDGNHIALAKCRRLAESLRNALVVFRGRPRLVIVSTALSAAIQMSGVVQVALIGAALGLDVPFAIVGIAVPMVALLTLLPVSLNGMGVREAGMVLFLQPAGVAASQAVAVAFLWFCSQTVAGLLGGVVYLNVRSRRTEDEHGAFVGDRADQERARQYRAAA
jgi:uncharacterized protein (TIRG00374 family)